MKLTISTLVLSLFTLTALAQEARYETVSVSATRDNSASNSIAIADYETGELISMNFSTGDGAVIKLSKDGVEYPTITAASQTSGIGTICRGPAVFTMALSATYPQSSALMTVKITPVTFPPDKTLIVPPGTNQVQVSMESSTNLVNWIAATNGVYGSPTEAQFFRLKMTKLN